MGRTKKASRKSKDELVIINADVESWNEVDGKACWEREEVKVGWSMTVSIVFRGRDPAFSGIRRFQQHDVSIWSNAKSNLHIIIEPSCLMSVCSVHLSHYSRNLLEAFPLLI